MNSGPNNNEPSGFDAQLAEYALGVMEPALASELERGLEECRERVLLAQQYSQVVGMLGYAANPAEPPEGHKSRFMARLGGTPQAAAGMVAGAGEFRTLPPVPRQEALTEGAIGPQAAAPVRVVDLAEERARRRSRLALPLVATVAAALVLLVGAWGWSMKTAADAATAELQAATAELRAAKATNDALTRKRDAYITALKTAPLGAVPFVVKGQGPAADSWALGLVNPGTNQATLVANDLPTLSANQVYEFWWLPQQQGKDPVPAGVFNTDPSGTARHDAKAPDPVASYAGVAVSIEPAPGVSKPTGQIVLVGNYSLP